MTEDSVPQKQDLRTILSYYVAWCGRISLRLTGSNIARGGLLYQRKVKPWSQDWLIGAEAYPGFCSMKRLAVFLLPLDGMLVHRRSLPRNLSAGFPQQFAGTHLCIWVERRTVRVKCLAQEHNTMSPARARARTAHSGIERTNHEATEPPTENLYKDVRRSCIASVA